MQHYTEIKSIMNVQEVAKYLSFSIYKIYNLVQAKKIPCSRVGKQYLFIKKEIDQWLKNHKLV